MGKRSDRRKAVDTALSSNARFRPDGQMKYGHIFGSTRMNTTIYRCFEYFTSDNARSFVSMFRNPSNSAEQSMHTFRELVVGGFLGSKEFTVRYEPSLDGKRPDWSVIDSDGNPAIVELVNFHIDKVTEDAINDHGDAGVTWGGFPKSHDLRLYHCIWDKMRGYKNLIEQRKVPYVVALFSVFPVEVDMQEIRECVSGEDAGLFSLYPTVSGLLFFDECAGRYRFTYIKNPSATRRYTLPCGVF